jgi:hypothetical protein
MLHRRLAISDVAAIREMREALRQAPALRAAADDPEVQQLFDRLPKRPR